ncbi:MAG: NYN domain-containing protein [Lentisphaerae bacterium]|jgi:hypothetical protein|nr:NYN domain-containing protein [Lentisphaerota bacterium]
MSLKAMIFVDGTWLYHGRQILFEALGEDGFEIDYKRIPEIVADDLEQWQNDHIDIVRTCYFGSLPINKPGCNPAKQKAFYDFLALQCGYDTEIVDIDYRREPTTRPDERWVGIALASSMIYYASIPGVFDVATLIAGDSEYIPLLQRVRAMGKRTHLVAINNLDDRNPTSQLLQTATGALDFPTLFLDEHAKNLRLVREEQVRECRICGNEEATTWAGPDFFCSQCRNEHRKQLRTCDACGCEEETSWDKPFFYCTQCRKEYRSNGSRDI